MSSGDALQEAPQKNKRENQSNLQPMSIDKQQASHTGVNNDPGAASSDVISTLVVHPYDSIESDQFG